MYFGWPWVWPTFFASRAQTRRVGKSPSSATGTLGSTWSPTHLPSQRGGMQSCEKFRVAFSQNYTQTATFGFCSSIQTEISRQAQQCPWYHDWNSPFYMGLQATAFFSGMEAARHSGSPVLSIGSSYSTETGSSSGDKTRWTKSIHSQLQEVKMQAANGLFVCWKYTISTQLMC